MLSVPRSEAQTRPTREPRRQPRDLMDELDVAGPDQHRHDRDAAGHQDLGLVGVERRRRHEVVVEARPGAPAGRREARPPASISAGNASTSRSAS